MPSTDAAGTGLAHMRNHFCSVCWHLVRPPRPFAKASCSRAMPCRVPRTNLIVAVPLAVTGTDWMSVAVPCDCNPHVNDVISKPASLLRCPHADSLVLGTCNWLVGAHASQTRSLSWSKPTADAPSSLHRVVPCLCRYVSTGIPEVPMALQPQPTATAPSLAMHLAAPYYSESHRTSQRTLFVVTGLAAKSCPAVLGRGRAELLPSPGWSPP